MYRLALLGALFTLLALTSCKKKCDASNNHSGIIIEDARIRVKSGKLATQNFINSPNDFSATIEMSLDNGETYKSIDFSKYSVFGLRTKASCSSGYYRDVLVDENNEIVTYTIDLTECETCDGETTISNWVLTEKVPSHYTAIFTVNRN